MSSRFCAVHSNNKNKKESFVKFSKKSQNWKWNKWVFFRLVFEKPCFHKTRFFQCTRLKTRVINDHPFYTTTTNTHTTINHQPSTFICIPAWSWDFHGLITLQQTTTKTTTTTTTTTKVKLKIRANAEHIQNERRRASRSRSRKEDIHLSHHTHPIYIISFFHKVRKREVGKRSTINDLLTIV